MQSRTYITIERCLIFITITKIIKPENENQLNILDEAAIALKDGEIVAIPTETVYGLGANAFLENSAKKIYEVKGRPSDNPLIVHIAEISEVENGDDVTLEIKVDSSDMGKVIGKQGKIAKAIRVLMRAYATKVGKKVNVEILD